jgi:choline dehydrogenase-like flavoprotein
MKLTRNDPGAAGDPGLLRVRVTAEPSPNPASRVTLAVTRDRFGLPRARLDWRIAPDDYRHVERSLALFREDVEQLGLGRLELRPPDRWPTRGAYHHMGTTRMSADPARGVVDADCRVHGLSNLYVAGSSVFPTAGSGTPTLMIVALALRLAEHLEAASSD